MNPEMIFKMVKGFLVLLLPFACLVWLIRRSIRKSLDRRQTRMKWCISLGITAGILIPVAMTGPSYAAAFIVPVACVILGIVLSLLWAPDLGALLAKPITSAIDGGEQEYEARPCYSGAIHQRKRGQPQEAIHLVRKELDRFPRDFEGEMMLAAIHAEDFKDLDSARLVIEKILLNPKTPSNQIAGALSTLADWQMSQGRNRDLAREAFQQIVDRLPDTEFATQARERIAHLASNEMLTASVDRAPIHLTEGPKRIGLMTTAPDLVPQVETASARAQSLVSHLKEFPEDTEAREQLARLYAEEYHRPEMGIHELESMIASPHQSAKRIVHWLNVIADIQVKQMKNGDAAAMTLQRIVDLNPNLASAEAARSRISLIKLELKAAQTPEALTLGDYEQRVGLRSTREVPENLRPPGSRRTQIS